MIELVGGDTLHVSFPEVHRDAAMDVVFQRTLRVPDDGNEYPLPAGLGAFPLYCVDDYDVPKQWKERGGLFLPMYQSEAMWLSFAARSEYPFAIKIAAGKVNAVTGSLWTDSYSGAPQEYVVVPEQRWLDGFYVAKGSIRQFVAARLGEGITIEEQITGKAEHGGVQLLFAPMSKAFYRDNFEKPRAMAMELADLNSAVTQAYEDLTPLMERVVERMERLAARLKQAEKEMKEATSAAAWQEARSSVESARASMQTAEKVFKRWLKAYGYRLRAVKGVRFGKGHLQSALDALAQLPAFACEAPAYSFREMGLGAGGVIRQEIAADPWGLEAWDFAHTSRCFVHLVNSKQFKSLTGNPPPTEPFTSEQYSQLGVPWFDYYLHGEVMEGSKTLAKVKSVSEVMKSRGRKLSDNKPIPIAGTVDLSKDRTVERRKKARTTGA